MPRPEKTAEIDRILEVIVKQDTRRRTRTRKIVSDELVEAMDYYVRWGLARNRGRALIELAAPMAAEVVKRVRAVGIKSVRDMTGEGAELPEPPAPRAKAPRKTATRAPKQGKKE